MKKHEIITFGLFGARIVSCFLAGYLFFLKGYNGLIAGFSLALCLGAFQNYWLSKNQPCQKLERTSILESCCDKIALMTFYFILMFLNGCPPSFIALVITISLIQATALLYLKWPDRKAEMQNVTLIPLPIGKINFLLQVASIFLVIPLLSLQIRHPELSTSFRYLELTTYLGLAGLQSYVFYCYCLRFHRFFLPGFRTFSTAS